MNISPNKRRLVAVLAADVVGYTKLVEQDTDGTVVAWKAARDDIIKPNVSDSSGHIIKFTGDGFLVEFPSVQDAVICAMVMQEGLTDNLLSFRMGINVGDVVDDGGDIHGEGVNIAARLEALAEPGSIYISGDVYNQVHNRIDTHYVDRGEYKVKHVTHPVQAYSIGGNGDRAQNTDNSSKKSAPATAHAIKPSIAVLPFDNMSTDAEQEYFCDGVVEDIITELSKFRWLTVIARNSSFSYKNKDFDIKTISAELGARYVVEGSVRKAGSRIRITAQLIDGHDECHLWAEHYDRELTDIFDLQDEITRTLVSNIAPELTLAELGRARHIPTENLEAWDLYQRAAWHQHQYTFDGYEKCISFCQQAIERDPELAIAYALHGFANYQMILMGWTEDRENKLMQAVELARKAIDLDPRGAEGHCAAGCALLSLGKHKEAEFALKQAITLNPNYSQAYYRLALMMALSGETRTVEVVEVANMAIKLSPRDPALWAPYNIMGWEHLAIGEIELAAKYFENSSRVTDTSFWPSLGTAATMTHLGRLDDAKEALAIAMAIKPDLSVASIEKMLPPAGFKRHKPSFEAAIQIGLPLE